MAGRYTLTNDDGDTIGYIRLNAGQDSVVLEHVPSGETFEISSGGVAGAADDPHGNAAHSETFAVDGDAQPPETHDHTGDSITPDSIDAGTARVTGTSDVTINVPSDESTLQAGVNRAIEQVQPRDDVIVDVHIDSGHVIETGINLREGNYSYVRITADDSPVTVGSGFPTDTHLFHYASNCWGPVVSCLVDAQGNCEEGLRVEDNSCAKVSVDCGVQNAGSRGIWARNSGKVDAPNTDFSGAGAEGVDAFRNSFINVFNADISDAAVDCVRGARSGMIDCSEATLTGAGQDAVRTSRNTQINVYRADCRNAGRNGIRTTRFSIVAAQGADLRGADINGVMCHHGGTVLARNTDISDTSNPVGESGILAERGGNVYADATTITGAGIHGIHCETGARVCAQGTDVSNSTTDGVHCIGGDVFVGNLTANDCTGNPVYTEVGGRVVCDGISSSGCGSPLRANEGSWVVARDGSLTTDANVDARADAAGILDVTTTATTDSTGSNPHQDDVNFTGFDAATGIIFGSFETP